MSGPFAVPRFSKIRFASAKGATILMSCPGVRFADAAPVATTDFLIEDADRLAAAQTRLVVSCLPREELALGQEAYENAFRVRDIEWLRVPIPDMKSPSEDCERTLDAAIERARRLLDEGETIAIHCMAGLGRTGTVAGRLATTYGLSGDDAIALIRAAHDAAAIETPAQEAYLRRLAPKAA
ncbi:MAG: dual specificity protein phosphatase family protein [Pseudomonadota bacterium]